MTRSFRECPKCHRQAERIEPDHDFFHCARCDKTFAERETASTLLMEMGRDLAYAQRDGRPLGPIESEYAARVANLYGAKSR